MKYNILLIMLILTSTILAQNYEQLQKIKASDPEAIDQFGTSVSIDGNYAVVGAWNEDDGGDRAGAAYFFELNNSGSWVEVAKVIASDAITSAQFGWSVSISGTNAVIGARHHSNSASNEGAAYFFERNNSGSWVETAKVVASNQGAYDGFGSSVAISGTYSIIGALYEDEGAFNAGTAYYFERNNSGSWVEVAKVIANDPANSDQFGYSVGISGTYSVIGANLDDNSVTDGGAAYFFERNNSGSWVQVSKVTASDIGASDNFGHSVAISGTYSVIGSIGEDDNGSDAGAAYFYERNNSGSWVEVANTRASDAENGDNFGRSVGISGTYSIIGANSEDENGSAAGAAYYFERNNSGSWIEVTKVLAIDGDNGDGFGWSVGITGTYSIVGSPGEDTGGSSAGAAYFFVPTNFVAPELYNLTAEATGSESATFYVDVADGGVTTTFNFEYGEIDNKNEFSYSNTLAGNSATINVGFEDDSNLAANTQYYVRASATNSVTWSESEEISFWTLATEPAAHSTLTQIGEEDNTIELSFDALSAITNGNGYLIVRSATSIGDNDLPVDGNSYNVDDIFGNSTVVAKITDNTAVSHTFNNLSKEQSWQFALVPYNEGDDVATTNYKTDDVPTIQGYTIPTLGEWGMIAFTLLMGIGGVWYARRS